MRHLFYDQKLLLDGVLFQLFWIVGLGLVLKCQFYFLNYIFDICDYNFGILFLLLRSLISCMGSIGHFCKMCDLYFEKWLTMRLYEYTLIYSCYVP